MMEIPDWFGPALAIAQHQDRINSWPAWQRWAHRLFVAWRCPCCKAARTGRVPRATGQRPQ